MMQSIVQYTDFANCRCNAGRGQVNRVMRRISFFFHNLPSHLKGGHENEKSLSKRKKCQHHYPPVIY